MAQDRLVIEADPGASPVGAAQDLSYPVGSIRVTGQIDTTVIMRNPANESQLWRLSIRSPNNSSLAVGCYERAHRFSEPERPEIDFSFGSSGCNNAFGRYQILELETDPGGAITSLAVNFNQQCEQYRRAVAGQIRFNSNVPISPDFPRAVIEPSGDFSFVAAPGAIGGGAPGGTANFDLERATLSVQGNFDNGATFNYSGPIPGSPTGNWSLNFAGPDEAPLEVGTYPTATRYPFQDPGVAGLSFNYGGSGCNTLEGSFVVTDVLMDGLDNIPLVLNAAFDQRCPNASGPLTEGTIIYEGNVIGPTSLETSGELLASGFEDGETAPTGSGFYTATCN
jgi:hypothetical protein